MQKFYCFKMKIGTSYDFWALVYFSKRLYIFKAISYFQSAFIFSKCFHIFMALSYFQSAVIFSWRFHIFMALSLLFFQSAFISFQSAFIYFLQMWVSAYLFSLSVSQRSHFLFPKTLFSSYFNFWMWSAQFLDMIWLFLIFLICFDIRINYVQNF